tara:strand:+ start:23314 stop:23739 length:426 start_codon:yes stop_codon:yes gene_type:complete
MWGRSRRERGEGKQALVPAFAQALSTQSFTATTFGLTAFDAALFAGFDVEHTTTALFTDTSTINSTSETFHRSFEGFAFFYSDFSHMCFFTSVNGSGLPETRIIVFVAKSLFRLYIVESQAYNLSDSLHKAICHHLQKSLA